MRVCCSSGASRLLFAGMAGLLLSGPEAAQQLGAVAAGKKLTVERIYSQPSLNGRMTRGLAWTPNGKQLTYFETKGAGKEATTELWAIDTSTGERKMLMGADKLESIMPSAFAIPMGAGRFSNSPSGADGARVAGHEVTGGPDAGFRKVHDYRCEDFARWKICELCAGPQFMGGERCGRQRKSDYARRN